ncbi:12966_t:CDS:2, partial [Dentiscutata erythropus]
KKAIEAKYCEKLLEPNKNAIANYIGQTDFPDYFKISGPFHLVDENNLTLIRIFNLEITNYSF